MTISYFDITVPMYIKSLQNLKQFFIKGDTHAKEIGMSESDFLAMRLAPDMFPLSRQIQIATDSAKGTVARLTETPPLSIADTESTTKELLERIDVVIAHLTTFTPEQFTLSGTVKVVVLPYYEGKYFTGHDYLVEFGLPNFYFHISMAYAIIRSGGVPLSKSDYLGQLTNHPSE